MYMTGCTCTSVPNWKVVLLATVISDVLAHTDVLEAQGGGESSAC